MNKNTIKFPQYRKMSNDKAFYKITSKKTFEEIQLIGDKAVIHQFTAEQYPEMLRILDMLEMDNDWFLPLSENEYEEILKRVDL